MLGGKYTLLEQIGEGKFGKIFKGENKLTQKMVAIKIENKQAHITTLKTEAKMYHYLSNLVGFCNLHSYGTETDINYLVIDLLGNSLADIVKQQSQSINYKTILTNGKQMIHRLQTLHERDIVHRDVKPDNFLFGRPPHDNTLYIIDFGLCKCYMKNDKHIPQRKISQIIGTPNFVSLNVHNCIEPSRRDDLESTIYALLYLYWGSLPWENGPINEIMYEKKKAIINDPQIPKAFKTI